MSKWIFILGCMYLLIGILGFLAEIFEGVKMTSMDHLVFLAGIIFLVLNHQLVNLQNQREEKINHGN